MSSDARTTYQEGSYEKVPRAKGPAAWVFRWRDAQGKQRRKTIGNVDDLPKLSDVKRAAANLKAEINANRKIAGLKTVADAWGDFEENELRSPQANRAETTIQNYLDYFSTHILPHWGNVFLDDVKAVKVEAWLSKLTRLDGKTPLAPGTKAKLRNHLSVLFNHAIRHEMYTKSNPIEKVRQSAKRQKIPETLTIEEIAAILYHVEAEAIRVMTTVAAASALRRSEVRGLKWCDLDFTNLWFNLRRGLVRKMESNLKTEASKKGLPMLPELAVLLQEWRKHTPYPGDEDWVFGSPYTNGKRPYWPDAALRHQIRPAAKAAGIKKHIGWHTFRHSVGTLLNANGENIKTIQELLRHANSRITLEIYVQSDTKAKRNALSNMSGIFIVPSLKKAG